MAEDNCVVGGQAPGASPAAGAETVKEQRSAHAGALLKKPFGDSELVFGLEPYQKSKAAEFHEDAIIVGFADSVEDRHKRTMVKFEPFVGVGPRRFFDLFSTRLGSGYPIERKDRKTGEALRWKSDLIRLRLQMLPASYLDLELVASTEFKHALERIKETGNG